MNKSITILLVAYLLTILSVAYSQPESLLDVAAPSGLYNSDGILYIGTYAEVSYKYGLKSSLSKKPIFNAHVFRTTEYRGNLYYSDSWNKISRYNLASGQTSVLFADGSNIFGVAIHGNDLYYSEWALGEIWKIDLTEKIVSPDLVLLGLDTLGAISTYNNHLYIAESGTGSILRLDLNGYDSTLDTMFHNKFVAPNELHVKDGYMYVSDLYADKISRYRLDDSDPVLQDVVLNITSPAGLASDEEYLYISSMQEDEILRLPLNTIPLLKKEDQKNPVTIYPNPNYGTFSVSNLTGIESYKIYNSKGKLIQSGIVGNKEEIQLNNKTGQTYFIQFGNSGFVKLIVMQ